MSTINGYNCIARTCSVAVRGPELSTFGGTEFYQSLLMGWGWTFWAGRTLAPYCPDHKPGKTHKMRQIMPDELFKHGGPRPTVDMLPNAWLVFPDAPRLHSWDVRGLSEQQKVEKEAVFDHIAELLGLQ